MGHSNHHEDGISAARPRRPTAEQEEHDLLSFAEMCHAVGQGARLRRLREQNRLLRHSAELAEDREEGERD